MARSQNVGFRVFTRIPRPPRALVEALGELETTHITDGMSRFGGMEAAIRPADPGMRLAGPAVTVRVPPGDNLMVYKAMEVTYPRPKPGGLRPADSGSLSKGAQPTHYFRTAGENWVG